MKLFFFCGIQKFSLPAAGLFLALSAVGHQGTRLYTSVQVQVPAGLHGTRSGSSKSRNLASNHGIAFHRARANQVHGNPPQNAIWFLFCALLQCTSICYKYHTSPQTLYTFTQPRYNTSRPSSFSLCDRHMNRASACACECVRHPRILQQAIGTMNTRVRLNFSSFVSAVRSAAVVCVSPRPPSSVRCDSHGETAVAFQGIPFATATNGVFVRACVCACVYHPQHNLADH